MVFSPSKLSMESAKPPDFGAVPAVALELVVSAFYVSAVIANITSVKVRDHTQETFSVYTVAAPCIVSTCFHDLFLVSKSHCNSYFVSHFCSIQTRGIFISWFQLRARVLRQ